MKKIFLSCFILLILMLVGCSNDNSKSAESNNGSKNGSNNSEVKTLKIATGLGPEAIEPLDMFKEEVDKQTNGSVEVIFHPNNQLGGDVQALEGVRTGSIEGTLMTPSIVATLDDRFNLFDIPFLFEDNEAVYKIFDGEIGQELLDELENVGIVGLGYTSASFRNLSNNGKEVRTPDDLEGLNIRTLENSLQVKLWETLGAAPQAIAFSELYSALETNVVEGQENPYPTLASSKIYEVQENLTETKHVSMPLMLMLSQKFWDELSTEEQDAIASSAEKAIEHSRAEQEKLEADAKQEIEDFGVNIIELTPEERKQWIDQAEPIYEDYKEVIGEDLFDRVMETVNE